MAFTFASSSPIVNPMGYLSPDKEIDLEKLGGVLVIGAAIILAIRTARREPIYDPRDSNRDWDQEMDFAINVADALVSRATCRHAELFRQTAVKVTDEVIVEEDVRL
jgi:hypothetical protein